MNSVEFNELSTSYAGKCRTMNNLQAELTTHLSSCCSEHINKLIPICCADLVISLQSAKNSHDKTWQELYKMGNMTTQ